jgi:hypothetical protein
MSEVTERESLIKYRNASCWVKSHRADDAEKSITGACLLVMYPPVYKGHDTHLGFFTELGRTPLGEMYGKEYME